MNSLFIFTLCLCGIVQAQYPTWDRPPPSNRPTWPRPPKNQNSFPTWNKPLPSWDSPPFKPPSRNPPPTQPPSWNVPTAEPSWNAPTANPSWNAPQFGNQPEKPSSNWPPSWEQPGTQPDDNSNSGPVPFPDNSESTTSPPDASPPARTPPQTFQIPPVGCNCEATTQFDPVCGSDGNNYRNVAILRCYSQCGNSVSVRYQGSCRTSG